MMQYSLFFILCLHGYFYTVIRLFNLALLHGLFDDLCINSYRGTFTVHI